MAATLESPLLANKAAAAGGSSYQIANSIRLNRADSSHLTRNFSEGNRRTWTWSCWVKRSKLGEYTRLFENKTEGGSLIRFRDNDQFGGHFDSATTFSIESSDVFRDPSAWYHLVVVTDSSNAIEADRGRLYVNGQRIDKSLVNNQNQSGAHYPTQNEKVSINRLGIHVLGGGLINSEYLNGYITDSHFIDGLALSPTAFAESDSTGAWNPKAFAIPAPNNGTTWSDTTSTPNSGDAVDFFDGDTSNSAYWSAANTDHTITTGTFTINNSLRIYGNLNPNNTKFKINDVYTPIITTDIGSAWNVIDLSNHTLPINVTSLKQHFKSASGISLSAIEVDGVILQDGVIDPTTRNNPNNGTKWSDYFTATSSWYSNSYLPQYAFDGIIGIGTLGHNGSETAHGSYAEFKPPTTITANHQIGLWLKLKNGNSASGEYDVKINGTSILSSLIAQGHGDWQYYTIASKTIDSTNGLYIGAEDSNHWCNLRAIVVDGHVLIDEAIDNSYHLKFDDTTAIHKLGKDTLNGKIADATGGLPIYNTKAGSTDAADYGDVKDTGYRSEASTTIRDALVLAIPGDTLTDYASFADEHVDDAATAFNGSLTGTYATAGSGTTGTFTFTGSKFTGITKLRIYGKYDSRDNAADSKILVNDEDIQVGSSAAWVTATEHLNSGALNTLKIVSDSYNTALYAIEIDDVVLQTGGDLDVHASINTGSSNKIATINGSVTVSTDESRLYGSSLYFAGDEDDLQFADHADFDVGTGDFTIEFWAKPTNTGAWSSIVSWPGSWDSTAQRIAFSSDGYFACGNTTTGNHVGSTICWDGNWRHYAVVRNGNTFKGYVNGIQEFTFTTSASYDFGGLVIGRYPPDSYPSDYEYKGYVNDFRFYKGLAKYTANFSPAHRNDFEANNIHLTAADGANYSGTHWGGGTVANLFDGNLSSATAVGGGDSWHGHTFTTPLNGVTKFEVRHSADNQGQEVRIRIGNAWQNANEITSTGWNVAYDGSSTDNVTEFGIRSANSGGCEAYAVRVNGSILINTSATHNDSSVDTPTNYGTDEGAGGEVRGNYCTLNPLGGAMSGGGLTISQGGLYVTRSGGSNRFLDTTWSLSSGKWYYEATAGSTVSDYPRIGIWNRMGTENRSNYPGQAAAGYNRGWGANGTSYKGNGDTAGGLPTFTEDDVLMFALDMDNGKIWFGKNGTWYTNDSSTTTTAAAIANNTATAKFTDLLTESTGTSWTPICHMNDGDSWFWNFGQRAYKYASVVPDGFKALCTQNLSDTFSDEDAGTVNNPSKFFDIRTYTGSGSGDDGTSQTIDGVNFQPDLVWLKVRGQSWWHHMFDAIRGAGKSISPNSQNQEQTLADNQFTSFDSDGFTVLQKNNAELNEGGESYVSWLWDAGTAAVTPSDSYDITPDAQWVNATAGFSMTKYTGNNTNSTVPHGLSAAPELMIQKDYSNGSTDWQVWHGTFSGTQFLQMSAGDIMTQADLWNSTVPNGNVFYLGTGNATNRSNEQSMMYCWTGIPGYSSFGSYGGGGDPTFVYTGMRPKLVIIKCTSHDDSWIMYDSERNQYNVIDDFLQANNSEQEATGNSNKIDILSNGFAVRGAQNGTAATGRNYIYCAWAEHPFKTARAR